MRISVFGNGNLAQNLCILLKESKHEIIEVYARNREKLNCFCNDIGAKPIYEVADLDTNVDLFIISITDDAIEGVLKEIKNKDKLIVHTSGSVSVQVFRDNGFRNFGVIYPLYSFSKKNPVSFKSIPFLLESNCKANRLVLESLIKGITDDYRFVDSKVRLEYHLVAIFVNNFTNFILGSAQELSVSRSLDFSLLKPILSQTAYNALNTDNIHSIQTGPAVRNNRFVIEKHQKILSEERLLEEVYSFLTQKIIDKNNT